MSRGGRALARIGAAGLLAAAVGCGTTPAATPREEPATPAPDWRQVPDFDALRERYGERDDFVELCERGRPLRAAFAALELQTPAPHVRRLQRAFEAAQ